MGNVRRNLFDHPDVQIQHQASFRLPDSYTIKQVANNHDFIISLSVVG